MEKNKMKKSLVFAMFSLLTFLSGNPEAKANSQENALNPLGRSHGVDGGFQIAECSLDNTLPADTMNNMRNAIDAAY